MIRIETISPQLVGEIPSEQDSARLSKHEKGNEKTGCKSKDKNQQTPSARRVAFFLMMVREDDAPYGKRDQG